MPISDMANEYIAKWAEDLKVKGFEEVKIIRARLPCIEAKRPDGKMLKGFAAFTPKDLDIKLWQGMEDAYDEGFIVFLVAPVHMMGVAEECLRVWNISKKVYLEGVE
ncbi:MAG: hypothetical protein LLG16_05200 [Euryarchaeota archaeon]|nr:hypothetical protein [Euryarchaeota archaeon]